MRSSAACLGLLDSCRSVFDDFLAAPRRPSLGVASTSVPSDFLGVADPLDDSSVTALLSLAILSFRLSSLSVSSKDADLYSMLREFNESMSSFSLRLPEPREAGSFVLPLFAIALETTLVLFLLLPGLESCVPWEFEASLSSSTMVLRLGRWFRIFRLDAKEAFKMLF